MSLTANLMQHVALSLVASFLLQGTLTATIHHVFNVEYFSGNNVDGVNKTRILGVNGQFPGPLIEATEGDVLIIDVVNKIDDGQNTTIHWHGLHQKNQFCEDGTTMISQCPLPAGQTQRYYMTMQQHGTFWYHSHVNSQYTEGLQGPFIVHSRDEIYNYDEEMVILLHDWYHLPSKVLEEWHLSAPARGVPPYINSGLINGHGRYPCTYAAKLNQTCDVNKQQRQVFKVQRDKTYRVRVINTSAVASFNFSIDGHTLYTIETDGIDTARPVPVDIVPIASGQRYSFLIRTNNTESIENNNRFLIRAHLRVESFMLIEGININKYPEALIPNVTAVLEYSDKTPTAKPVVTLEPHSYLDTDPPQRLQNPKYIDESELGPYDGIRAPEKVDQEFNLHVGFYEDHEDIRRGSFNQTPFVFPSHKPLINMVMDNETIPDTVYPLVIEHMNVIQLVVNNPFMGPHPFHLHGHHFWLLGAGKWNDGDFDPSKHNLTLDGVKRDTFIIQENSWAVIRFVADNPGVFLFHCHIDWHALSGMALAFIEAPDVARETIQITDEAKRVCKMHEQYYS